MYRRVPFVENELKVIGSVPGIFNMPDTPIRDTPVSPRTNVAAMYYDRHPFWASVPGESAFFASDLYNSKLGRGGWTSGTIDFFGLEWVFIETAGGSIVHPGNPLLKDVNEWKDKIKIPDIDEWDWAGEAEKSKIDQRFFSEVSFINGFMFERLISFMDFIPAAMALIDEEQKGAIKSLFEALAELAIKLVDKFCEYWPALDSFNIHDDWGSQMAPFFSDATARELFLPYLKALCDHIHSKGRIVTLHCCGHSEDRIRVFIEAGIDQWTPQIMNDTPKLYEEFGDKIVIGVVPDKFDPATTPEEEQRARARDFVDRFVKPGKVASFSFYGAYALTPAFSEELYVYSRKKLAGS